MRLDDDEEDYDHVDDDDAGDGNSGDDDDLEGEPYHSIHLHAQMPVLREDTLPLYHTLYHLCDTITTTSPSANTSRALLNSKAYAITGTVCIRRTRISLTRSD